MTTARTLVRFAFAGLFVNALAVACVVSDGDDKDDDNTACDPGSYKDCTCANGDEGTKKCNASGSGYSTVCTCDDTSAGGGNSGGEGNTPMAGTAGTAGSSSYGGETNGGAGGEGGVTMSMGAAGAGGEGGAAVDPDAVCIESSGDDCIDCMQLDCCEAWKACAAETEGDCMKQAEDIMICASVTKRGPDDAVTPEELQDCGAAAVEGGSVWSDGLLPTTKAVIDCVAGGQGWGAKDDLSDSTCEALCFIPTVE